jgi:hypothetical protein
MGSSKEDYVARRKKEDLSFMIVRFLKAYESFEEIYETFRKCIANPNDPVRTELFDRINDLEEKLFFDIKEKAHFLFRSTGEEEEVQYVDLEEVLRTSGKLRSKRSKAKKTVTHIRKSLMNKSIDSYIGTGFHMIMILRESIYQLERYVPRFEQEHENVKRIDTLMEKYEYELDDENIHELGHIRELDSLFQTIIEDTRSLSLATLERCRSVFRETATVLRHFMVESATNEVLVLNLLRERELLEKVYGDGAPEQILTDMFEHIDIPGSTGIAKALNYVKTHCSNVDSLVE